MRLAIIAPTNQLWWCTKSDYHLCLARKILTEMKYASFYRAYDNTKHYMIMDNGAAEEGTLKPDELFRAANLVHANELVVPDKINNYQATTQLAKDYAKDFNGSTIPLMVVPQGESWSEWLGCLELQLTYFKPKSIGISKYSPIDRAFMLGMIEARELHTEYEYHLLGIQRNPREVSHLAYTFPWVRGVDTGAMVAWGLKRHFIAEDRRHIALNWNSPVPGLVEKSVIEANIEQMKEWCNVS